MEQEQEKKRQLKLRQERMLAIVKKIAREMNGIRFEKRSKSKEITALEEISYESLSEEATLFELPQGESEGRLIDDKVINAKITEIEKADQGVANEEEKEETKSDFKRFVTLKQSKSTVEVFPEDKSFFAIPGTVIFDVRLCLNSLNSLKLLLQKIQSRIKRQDFKINQTYSRKLIVRNKTAKWAYLRFHKIYTDVWEPGIVEIDIIAAARVKPGLDLPVTVKFSPLHEEEITAEIAFLTLAPDHEKTFHEFRVPVRCTPQSAVPVVEPAELRFPRAAIWSYESPNLNERLLTISNDGGKPFSIALAERSDREHCFSWHFDQAELQSVEAAVFAS